MTKMDWAKDSTGLPRVTNRWASPSHASACPSFVSNYSAHANDERSRTLMPLYLLGQDARSHREQNGWQQGHFQSHLRIVQGWLLCTTSVYARTFIGMHSTDHKVIVLGNTADIRVMV